jgi:NADPH:quinone reductase-like Zn-dependent oxidoreductase
MMAISVDRYDGSEVLALVEIDAPTPGPGEVLVRNRAVDAVRVRGENTNMSNQVPA